MLTGEATWTLMGSVNQRPSVSVAFTITLKVPAAVGVPPRVAANLSVGDFVIVTPGGTCPSSDQTYSSLPPDARSTTLVIGMSIWVTGTVTPAPPAAVAGGVAAMATCARMLTS